MCSWWRQILLRKFLFLHARGMRVIFKGILQGRDKNQEADLRMRGCIRPRAIWQKEHSRWIWEKKDGRPMWGGVWWRKKSENCLKDTFVGQRRAWFFTVLKECLCTAWLDLGASGHWEHYIYRCLLMGTAGNSTHPLVEWKIPPTGLGNLGMWESGGHIGILAPSSWEEGWRKLTLIQLIRVTNSGPEKSENDVDCFPLDPKCECCLHRGKHILCFSQLRERDLEKGSSQPGMVNGNHFFRTYSCYLNKCKLA